MPAAATTSATSTSTAVAVLQRRYSQCHVSSYDSSTLTPTVIVNGHNHNPISHRYKSSMMAQVQVQQEEEEEEEASSSNTIPFLLADIGEGIHEVEILKWYIQPGDVIEQFDQVCEVQSDKATVDITSRYDGTVDRLCGAEGEMIQVGTPLLYMKTSTSTLTTDDNDEEDNEKDGDVVINAKEETTSSLPPARSFSMNSSSATSSATSSILATPAVRRMSMEHSLDLHSIKGSGKDGRILKSDLLTELKLVSLNDVNGDGGDGDGGGGDGGSIAASSNAVQEEEREESVGGDVVVQPIRGYNRIMVNSMTLTLQVPHMVYSDEIDMSSLKKCREELNHGRTNETGKDNVNIKLSYLPFAIKACSLALTEYPIMNTSIDVSSMTLTYHPNHDIGVAIDSSRGLVVPVIRSCQSKSIMDIAKELIRLRDLAQNGNLDEGDLIGPTFTLSNIGAIGGTYMSPVVLPPQVAIGAMGKIQRLPRFVESDDDSSMEVREAHLMNISWGGDHRVIDGGTLGRFSNVWKGYMEAPLTMITNMK